MNPIGRVIFFAIAALQLLVAGVISEETKACDQLSSLPCDDITSEHVQRCIEENPQIDDVMVQYFGVEDITKKLRDGRQLPLNFAGAESTSESAGTGNGLADTAVCKWTYKTDLNRHRIPSNISHAICTDESTSYTTTVDDSSQYQCRQILYPMNVLKWRCEEDGFTKKWDFTQEMVSFGCSLMETE